MIRFIAVALLCCLYRIADAAPVVWTEHSALKVQEVTSAPLRAKLGSPVTMRLDSARNEWETAQLLVRSDTDLIGVNVKVGGFECSGKEAASPADQVEVRVAHSVYYQYYDKSKDAMINAWQPDPLPLLREPVQLPANKTQAFYIQFHINRDAVPGLYTAPVELSWDGGKQTHRLQLKVWPVTLPETPPATTAFGISKEMAAEYEGVDPQTSAAQRIHEKYYEMLLDYGMSAYHLPVEFSSPKAAEYAEDPRVSCFVIDGTLSDDLLTSQIALLKKKGWWKKAYFYTVDEPVTTQSYALLREHAARYKRLSKDSRVVAPFFCRSEPDHKKTFIDEVGDLVNINCCLTEHYNQDTTVSRQMAEAQRLGKAEAWWYVCCNPRAPYANLFVSQQGMEHRILPWQMKQHNITGLLYWRTNHWIADGGRGTADPWRDMATVKDIDKGLYGDGSLFYPGKKVGVDGPVPSIRMMNLRDGLEDLALLNLVEKTYGRQTAISAADALSRSLKDYTHDPLELEHQRIALLKKLSK